MIHKCIACNKVLSSRSSYTQHCRTKHHTTNVLLYNVSHESPFQITAGVIGRPYIEQKTETKSEDTLEAKADDIVLELEEENKPYIDGENFDVMELLEILKSANKSLDPSSYNHQVLKAYAMKCTTIMADIQNHLYQLVLR